MKRLLIVCGIAALLLVPAALAGKASTATVAVNPNPVVSGSPFSVSGCGYSVGETLWVSASLLGGGYATTDSSGCFALTWLWNGTGTAEIVVYDASHGTIKNKALAAVYFSVVAVP